jgi:hypothetical protein
LLFLEQTVTKQLRGSAKLPGKSGTIGCAGAVPQV